jgi:hypothetical protein
MSNQMVMSDFLEELSTEKQELLSGGKKVFRSITIPSGGGPVTQAPDEQTYPAWAKGQGGKCFIRSNLPEGTIQYPDDPSQYPIFVGSQI